MNAITNSERLKKVMRIALVGIRPADQIMLKGYLRILLRLEADLEWVSANHEAVDLFMINSEFSNSESVQRLLTTKPKAAALYVSRNDTGNGHLVGNLLTLPLTELEELKQWLAQNIGNLSTATSPASVQSASNQPAVNQNAPTPRQSLDDILASRNNGSSNLSSLSSLSNQATLTKPTSPQSTTPPSTTPSGHYLLSLINILIELQRRNDGLVSLVTTDNTVLAHIQPKQQRIWLVANEIAFNQNLQLIPQATFQADPTQSQDLVQWLWQHALSQAPYLTGLLRPQLHYHITSWVKPAEGKARHDQLKIQSVLESREVTLAELAQLSQCDHDIIKRSVIALVMAGVMPTTVYQHLHKLLDTPQVSTAHTAEPTVPISQPIENIPPASVSVANSAQTAEIQQDISQNTGDKGMKGFLSSLRRKLGI